MGNLFVLSKPNIYLFHVKICYLLYNLEVHGHIYLLLQCVMKEVSEPPGLFFSLTEHCSGIWGQRPGRSFLLEVSHCHAQELSCSIHIFKNWLKPSPLFIFIFYICLVVYSLVIRRGKSSVGFCSSVLANTVNCFLCF